MIENEMKSSFIDYSMSVIVSRALPDGLKPVHRRVLYGMYEQGYEQGALYNKHCRYSSVLVRMAQSWSLRYILIDGQGNFGS